MAAVSPEQRDVCDRFGADPVPAPDDLKVGIALNVRDGGQPLNAIRHLPVGDTTGWYIWAGEIDPRTEGDDFFVPLHTRHLPEWRPEILPYLALPPGFGVVLGTDYEDVWFDEELVTGLTAARFRG